MISRSGLAGFGDDRQDRYWAGAVSAALHLALILLTVASSTGGSRRSGDTFSGHGASTTVSFEPTEFRQKVKLVARSEDSQRPAESLPENTVHPPNDSVRAPPTIAEVISPSSPGSSLTVAELPQAGVIANIPQAGASASASGAAAGSVGNPDKTNLRDAYMQALRGAILDKWDRPKANLEGCMITLEQGGNGLLVSARVSDCTLSDEQRDSLESAALMAQPLPYAGYETVYKERLELNLALKNRPE